MFFVLFSLFSLNTCFSSFTDVFLHVGHPGTTSSRDRAQMTRVESRRLDPRYVFYLVNFYYFTDYLRRIHVSAKENHHKSEGHETQALFHSSFLPSSSLPPALFLSITTRVSRRVKTSLVSFFVVFSYVTTTTIQDASDTSQVFFFLSAYPSRLLLAFASCGSYFF